MKPHLAVLVLSATLFACRTTPQSSIKTGTPGPPIEDLELAKCENGDLAFFNVVEKDGLSPADFSIYSGSVPVSSQSKFRLDICMIGEEPTIKRMVGTGEKTLSVSFTEISNKSIIKGLKEAIFGDYSQLEIRIPVENWVGFALKPTQDILYIQGNAKGGLIATIVQASGDGFKQKSDSFFNFTAVGEMVYEEPKEYNCLNTPGVTSQQKTFDSVTLDLMGRVPNKFGTSNGAMWSACRVVLTDSNPKLPEEARRPMVVSSDAKDSDPRANTSGGSGPHGTCAWSLYETPWAYYATRGPIVDSSGTDCSLVRAPELVPVEPSSYKIVYKSDLESRSGK